MDTRSADEKDLDLGVKGSQVHILSARHSDAGRAGHCSRSERDRPFLHQNSLLSSRVPAAGGSGFSRGSTRFNRILAVDGGLGNGGLHGDLPRHAEEKTVQPEKPAPLATVSGSKRGASVRWSPSRGDRGKAAVGSLGNAL